MPPVQRKADSGRIASFIEDLAKRRFLKYGAKSTWPRYIFHHASLENAVSILVGGWLYSRSRLDELGIERQENANLEIIQGTPPEILDCVRFYFRPRTPTQYNMEGIRPRNMRPNDANCAVPIFLLFDTVDILTQADSRFSDGNLRRWDPFIGSSADDLERLPFGEIYHDEPYDRDEHPDRTYHKNAEVIVPREVEVDRLERIVCRTSAEREALLNSMPRDVRRRWEGSVSYDSRLYFNRWTFVELVDNYHDRISLRFNPDTRTPGPFDLSVEASIAGEGVVWEDTTTDFFANGTYELNVGRIPVTSRGTGRTRVAFRLDGEVAYITWV